MVLVDIAYAAGGLLTAIVAVVTAVNWIVRKEVQILRDQIEQHNRQHDRERVQVAAAFKRAELHPPDGWNGGAPPPPPPKHSLE